MFANSDWASYSDAGVLQAIQDGWRLNRQLSPIGNGGAEWHEFFQMQEAGEPDDILLQQWGVAEQAGVDFGIDLASHLAESATLRERIRIGTFVGFGNAYRSFVSDGSMFTVDYHTSDYQLILDVSVSLVTRPLLDPRTGSSQFFVREFAQNIMFLLLMVYTLVTSATVNIIATKIGRQSLAKMRGQRILVEDSDNR